MPGCCHATAFLRFNRNPVVERDNVRTKCERERTGESTICMLQAVTRVRGEKFEQRRAEHAEIGKIHNVQLVFIPLAAFLFIKIRGTSFSEILVDVHLLVYLLEQNQRYIIVRIPVTQAVCSLESGSFQDFQLSSSV